MKLTLPMLWSALIVFAALVLMPWMLMPATPDPSPVLESFRGRLERMTHLLEQQNRLLASSGQAGGLAGLAQGGSGAPGPGGWQPNAVRASLQTHRQRNDVVLQALVSRLAGDDEQLWDEFYFRSMSEVMAELGRPDEFYSRQGQFFVNYKNVPCTIDGEREEVDLELRFQDGICVAAYLG